MDGHDLMFTDATRVVALRVERVKAHPEPVARPGDEGRITFLRGTPHGSVFAITFPGGWVDALESELVDPTRFKLVASEAEVVLAVS